MHFPKSLLSHCWCASVTLPWTAEQPFPLANRVTQKLYQTLDTDIQQAMRIKPDMNIFSTFLLQKSERGAYGVNVPHRSRVSAPIRSFGVPFDLPSLSAESLAEINHLFQKLISQFYLTPISSYPFPSLPDLTSCILETPQRTKYDRNKTPFRPSQPTDPQLNEIILAQPTLRDSPRPSNNRVPTY